MSENGFSVLSKINVTEYVEKKGKFSYLSWPFAVAEISKIDPTVTWEFPDPVSYPDGTMMVFCNVVACGKTMRGFLPVMDNRNAAIANPNAFDINKAYQRCLVKAIALHGLGLYIYAGEDLPEVEPKVDAVPALTKVLNEAARYGTASLNLAIKDADPAVLALVPKAEKLAIAAAAAMVSNPK